MDDRINSVVVDSHCHLLFQDYSKDLDDVIARAQNAGVVRLLNICSKIDDIENAKALSKRFDFIHHSIGIHPNEIDGSDDDPIETGPLFEAGKGFVVAVGESGLDYYRLNEPESSKAIRHAQILLFEKHLEYATKSNLPIVVHSRSAEDDTLNCLKNFKSLRGVMHCFLGGTDFARKVLDLGFYISFSGVITFKKAMPIHDVIKFTPIERILSETDCPYLSPNPNRGRRNEPAFVVYVRDKIAEIKGLDKEALGEKITENYDELFYPKHIDP